MVSTPRLLGFKDNGIRTHEVKSPLISKIYNFMFGYETNGGKVSTQ